MLPPTPEEIAFGAAYYGGRYNILKHLQEHAKATASPAAGMAGQTSVSSAPLSRRRLQSYDDPAPAAWSFRGMPMRGEPVHYGLEAFTRRRRACYLPAMLALAFHPVRRLAASIGRGIHRDWSKPDLIAHKTIGSGDEPERICVIVDPLPGDRQRNFADWKESQSSLLVIRYLITLPQ